MVRDFARYHVIVYYIYEFLLFSHLIFDLYIHTRQSTSFHAHRYANMSTRLVITSTHWYANQGLILVRPSLVLSYFWALVEVFLMFLTLLSYQAGIFTTQKHLTFITSGNRSQSASAQRMGWIVVLILLARTDGPCRYEMDVYLINKQLNS